MGKRYSLSVHLKRVDLTRPRPVTSGKKEKARMVRILSVCLTITAVLLVSPIVSSQSPRNTQKRNQRQTVNPKPQPSLEAGNEQKPEPSDVDTVKIDTDLVLVPVIATDLNGNYIPDLKQTEFAIEEDSVKQEIAFFATVSAPFHVVLMLDTSGSTEDKLGLIRSAAISFTEQLQRGDRVKVISFDDEVRELSEFTNDKSALKAAINKTRAGEGTKLYDAMELALNNVRSISGRKAIVIFTDGVDWHSDQASFNTTLRGLDEEGVIVYPIRYDTRAQTERIAREQSEQITPELPTIGVIRRPPSGTTAPTFPGEGPDSVPTSGTRQKTGPLGLPLPGDIMRPRPEMDPNRLPSPDDPAPSRPRGTYPEPRTSRPQPKTTDSISTMLDGLYVTADEYLKKLADKSGGKVLRADTLVSLPDAFAKIAAELRTQYSIGYYPTNKNRDETYRKIRVTTTRKNVAVRARPGYQAPAN
jgi:Mg-chelatase subunit ChlD